MDYRLLLLATIFGAASFFLAKAKSRNPWLWLLLGLFFSFVPLLVLAILPDGDLEDEIYGLQARVRQLEEAKQREGIPDVKVQKAKAEQVAPPNP